MLTATLDDPAVLNNLDHELTALQRLLDCLPNCPTREARQRLQQQLSSRLKQVTWYLIHYATALANNAARFTDLFGRIGLIIHTFFRLIGRLDIIQTAGPILFALPFSLAGVTRITEVAMLPNAASSLSGAPIPSGVSTIVLNSAIGIAMIAWIIAAIDLLSSSLFSDAGALKATTAMFSIAASRNLLKAILQLLDSFEMIQTSSAHQSLAKILDILDSMAIEGFANIAAGASIFATAMLTFINVFYNGPRPPSEDYDPKTLTIIAFVLGGVAGLFAVLLKKIAPAAAQSLLTIFAMFHSAFGAANLIVIGTSLTIPDIGLASTFSAHETPINAAFISLVSLTVGGNIIRGIRRYHKEPETRTHTSFALPDRTAYLSPLPTSAAQWLFENAQWAIITLFYIIIWGLFSLTGLNEAYATPFPQRNTKLALQEPLISNDQEKL